MNSISHIGRPFARAVVILMVAGAVARAANWIEIDAGLPRVSLGVTSLAIDPASPSGLYALTVGNSMGSQISPGLFKSVDGGGSWRAIRDGVTSLAIDPTNSTTLYAGTSLGVVKSTNAGASWVDAGNNLPSGTVARLLIDPSTPSTLYALITNINPSFGPGANQSAIFKTTDAGHSWTALNTGFPPSAYITVLALAPSAPSTLYAFAPAFDPTQSGGPLIGGLLKSTDGGQSWNTLNTLPAGAFVSYLAIDPINSSTVYATTNGGLYKSSNGGQSWTDLKSGLPPNTNVSLVVIDRAAPSAVYVAATSFLPTGAMASLLKSTDGGTTWSKINLNIPSGTVVNALVLDPMSPYGIYVGAYGLSLGLLGAPGGGASGGVFKSTDGGDTWNSANAGLSGFDVRGLAVNSVDGAVYAGGFGGVAVSFDGGGTWQNANLKAYTSVLVSSANSSVVYAFTGKSNGCNSSDALLLSSHDGGANWSSAVSPLNSGCILNAVFPSLHGATMAIDPSNPNNLYLGESDNQDGYSALLKSTDQGASWSNPWDWFNGLRAAVRAIAVDPANPATVYAGLDDGSAVTSGLFRSTDGGATWSNTNLTQSAVALFAIDPSNPQILYAETEGHSTQPAGFQGLFKSIDGGQTWFPINAGLEGLIGVRSATGSALIIDPANPSVLYLATSGGGIFRSIDGGAGWGPFNDGLTSLAIRALAVASGSSHAVYAATAGGVFKYVVE
jgi:photosystem II stability/assembly factor-like uncharacterized protein